MLQYTKMLFRGVWLVHLEPHLQKDKDRPQKVKRHCTRFAYQGFNGESSITQVINAVACEPLTAIRAKMEDSLTMIM